MPTITPKPYHKNPRRISKKQTQELAAWLQELGDLSGVVHDLNSGEIIGGNQRSKVFDLANCEIEIAQRLPEPDAQGTVAHGFVIWQGARYAYREVRWTPEQCEKACIIANKAGGDWDMAALELNFKKSNLLSWGFDPAELKEFTDDTPRPAGKDPGSEYERAAELVEKWGVERGQYWRLGQHRIACIESGNPDAVARLFDGVTPDAIIGDPPYCSGGFQEAGKKSGSIGTRGETMIENDTLSTRGYIALIRSVLAAAAGVGVVYLFTDWRMWVNLFDVVEASGFGVRNMIVWDKGTPGMGRGWRSQHELIMAAMKVAQPFDPHKAQGNVIQSKRTGNKLHPTEKPVDLIETILDVTDIAKVIFDPFLGSGTTLVACENKGRVFFGSDKDRQWVAVTLQRWAELTGKTPELITSPGLL